MRILLTCALMLGASSAHAACTVPVSSFFKNPHCVVVSDEEYVTSQGNNKPSRYVTIVYSSSDNGITSQPQSSISVTRNYALGDEPGIGKPGTQSVPRGLRETSRRTMSQALASRSTLTGPAVRTDPVTGAKSLQSVEVTYSNSRSESNNRTSGPGQQR